MNTIKLNHQKENIQQYLPEFVYGGIDGCITTFAVVAGANGAHLDSAVIIILGLANLVADGFSMSVGCYLAAKSEQQIKNTSTPHLRKSIYKAIVTFIAFFIMGIIPLMVYIYNYFSAGMSITYSFEITCLLTFGAFVSIGILKNFVTQNNVWLSIGETVLLGGIAAFLAYFTGHFLERMM